jgi:hypothetical protein
LEIIKEETMEENNDKKQLLDEMIYCGIGSNESVLHFGACYFDQDFMKTLDEFELDIEYTAVDVDDNVKTLFTDYQPYERTHPWTSVQESMQEFIDNITEERYNWTIISGIFDKPIYTNRQYLFIDTVVGNCLKFSDNLIITIDIKQTPTFEYNVGFLILHFISKHKKITVKKITDTTFIFCINN